MKWCVMSKQIARWIIGRQLRSQFGLLLVLVVLSSAHSQILWMKGGHGRAVWQIKFSTDGRFLLSAGLDNTIKVWDASVNSPRFGQLIASARAHVAGVASIAESNGQVVSGGGAHDNRVRLWRLQANGQLMPVAHWQTQSGYGVTAVAFVNWLVNGQTRKIIVAGSYGAFLLIDPNTGATLWYQLPWMPGDEPRGWTMSITGSRSRSEFAIGTDRGYIYVVRASSFGNPIAYPDITRIFNYGESVFSVQYDATENVLLAGGRQEWLYGWNLNTGTQVFSVHFKNSSGGGGWIWSVHAYRWSGMQAFRQYFVLSGWTWDASGVHPTVITYLWDTVSAVPPEKCGEIVLSSVSSFTALKGDLSPSLLYAVGTEYGAIVWWSMNAPCASGWVALPSLTIYYKNTDAPVRSVSFSHDDAYVASGSDKKTHVWDINGNLVLEDNQSGKLWALRFSPTEHRLVMARGSTVKCLLPIGGWARSFGEVTGGVAFAPDGSRLLVACNGGWRVLDAMNGGVLWTRNENVGDVYLRLMSCAWSPDNRYLAVGRVDGRIRIYSATDYTLFAELRAGNYMNPSALAFGFVGNRLKLFVGTTTGKLQMWDVANRVKEAEVTAHSEWISSLDIRGNVMVSASTEVPCSIKVWWSLGDFGWYDTICDETGTGVRDAVLSSRSYYDPDGNYRYLAYGREDATLVVRKVRFIPRGSLGHRSDLEWQELDER